VLPASSAFELRPAFFDVRLQPFFGVLAVEEQLLQFAFEPQALG
jgi:hypothetical protein